MCSNAEFMVNSTFLFRRCHGDHGWETGLVMSEGVPERHDAAQRIMIELAHFLSDIATLTFDPFGMMEVSSSTFHKT